MIIFTRILLFSHKIPADFMNYLRFLAAFFILSVCFSCKTKEVVKPNSPPSPFTVTATLADNGKDIILKWTKSKDPDGDAVTYTVVYKDTLIRHLNDTTYIIKNVPYDTEVKGSIVAKDLKGGANVAQFSSKTPSLYIKIPDINFENALIRLKIDDIQDGQVLRSNAEKVTDLRLNNSKSNNKISSLTGIESFINLTYLDCTYNQLISLDVSKNTNLVYLFCYINQLDSLDISKNTKLIQIDCGGNNLISLDVSKNKAMRSLAFASNEVTNLDISNNLNLERLTCSGNQLTHLDLSKNIGLRYLDCSYNSLVNLDISNNSFLDEFYCSYNQLTRLDLSKNTVLRNFSCFVNNLTSLDVSKNTKLRLLSCSENQLLNLDISKNTILENLYCQNNKIQTICVSNLNQPQIRWQKDPTATYKVCN